MQIKMHLSLKADQKLKKISAFNEISPGELRNFDHKLWWSSLANAH